MNNRLVYRSYALDPINIALIVVSVFIFPILFSSFIIKIPNIVFCSLLITLIILAIYLFQSFTEISITSNTLKARKYYKTIDLDGFAIVGSWWSYEFGHSPFRLSRYSDNKGESLSNPIKCFVRLKGKEKEIIIYEEISNSDKFPNELPYSNTEEFSDSILFRISDLNECLNSLNLK